MFPGMQLENAWKLCGKMDTLIEEKIDFAFDNNYGYLTCCPTNLGTGIRASAMLHLPALTMTGYIRNVLEACGKLSIAVRGLYGENSEASGDMYQVSNQVTLGANEEEIIENVTRITSQIMEQERTMRNELYKQNSFRFEDKVFRSLGILSNARVLTTEESLKYISDVRLGVEMGLLPDVSLETLNEITIFTQPANLQKLAGRPLNPEERDVKRAEFVRDKLKG
jgi:protein arginine kinase